jgi:PIN domain nuclease of toxin-antitoxin system
MKLLLDTVALYRAATAPHTLSARVTATLADSAHQLFVSTISAWELSIKSSLGKLPLPCPVEQFFTQASRDLLAQTTTLELRYVAKLAELPRHHADPFDRLLIAQALVDDCTVVTSDPRFAAYGARILW